MERKNNRLPDVIYVAIFGCTPALLDLIERIGASSVQITMNKDQYEYVTENMRQKPNGRWVRKNPLTSTVR
jgi:hypothetical protein